MSGIILPLKNLLLRVGASMLLLLVAITSIAQNAGSENVGIGTTKPDVSAILDLTSNSKGLLIPRMTLAQRGNIKSPANGLMVYQTDFFAGFYFFDGATWKGLYARSADGAVITSTTTTSNENSWNTTGNSGLNSDVNFIGTLDTTSLTFKVNNYRSGFIDYRFGNTYLGYRAGYRSHGFNSVAIGAYALHEANLGLNNIAIGYQSLPSSKTGSDNIALGSNALYNNITGSENIAIGTQAGLRSLGDGNVFIGHKAGLNEIGDNKLYIDNNFSAFPLIYGNFETAKVGINTKTPTSAFSIDSKVANVSGLEFKQLTNKSPAGRPTQKVLTVDDNGRVILVRDSIGYGSGTPPTVVPSYWALKGSSIENSNAGDVILSNLRFKNLRPISPLVKSNLKVLTVDDNGLIVLTKDSVGATPPSYWYPNGNNLSNSNNGKLVLNGQIQFNDLTSNNKAFNAYGKVLSVDNSGNLILVRDSVGTSGGTVPVSFNSSWTINGSNITNNNVGTVFINNDLNLTKLNSNNATTVSAQKFLTVDADGKVILANSPVSTGVAPSSWSLNNNDLSNSNAGDVYINHSLWLKNDFRIEAGRLELNSGVDNRSGLQLYRLKSSSPAAKSTGKVLTVNEFGDVILVNDSVSAPINPIPVSTSTWSITGNDISNNNTGKVLITNGLTAKNGFIVESGNLVLNQIKLTNTAAKSSGKVLSVDDNGNVILVKDSVSAPTNTIPVSTSSWAITGNDIANNNTGKVSINALHLPQITSATATAVNAQKFLTVDASGNVILANAPSSTVTPIPTSTSWTVTGNDVTNANSGKVFINNGLSAKNGLIIESGNIVLSQLKSTVPAGKPYGKVLTVDENGKLILVRDSVATGGGTTPIATPSPWSATGNAITNSNIGGVLINNGLTLVQITSATATAVNAQKFLTVDASGNVILANTVTPIIPPASTSPWSVTGNDVTNANTGKVLISNGLALPQITSATTTAVNAQKFLTVDASGNVILANTLISPAVTSPWSVTGNDVTNANSGKVFTNNGLTAKNGLVVESGNFVLNQLKLTSIASKSSGKVLSVDDNGNVILVKDSVGTVTGGTPTPTVPSPWALTGNNIANSNAGSVYVNNNFVLSKLSSNNTPTITSQKVLSVDADGNVILVNTPSAVAPVASPELWKANATGGIVNNSTSGIIVNSGVDAKSGFQFAKLNAFSPLGGRSYGKVLSVDEAGNIILIDDAVGGGGWNNIDGRLHNSNNDGKVVIGTGMNSFPDGFQLFVRGGILTERVRVALANSDRWADYVFKKDYKLMPLHEVEKFINHHQHLPNVPSAEEMAKNGMDVMETSAKLMEKLEELTLYMIEANKKIEALETKVKSLEKEQK